MPRCQMVEAADAAIMSEQQASGSVSVDALDTTTGPVHSDAATSTGAAAATVADARVCPRPTSPPAPPAGPYPTLVS